jgi:hypothetical protein
MIGIDIIFIYASIDEMCFPMKFLLDCCVSHQLKKLKEASESILLLPLRPDRR